MAFERFLANRPTAIADTDVAEAQVGLAELRGPAYAKEFLVWEWPRRINRLWPAVAYRHVDVFYEARLRWAANDRQGAIDLMRKFVQFPQPGEFCEDARDRLKDWEKQGSGRVLS